MTANYAWAYPSNASTADLAATLAPPMNAIDASLKTVENLAKATPAVAHARFTVTAGVTVSATTWTSCPFNATVDASTPAPPYTLNTGPRTITITQSGVYLISASISASFATFALRITVGGVVVAQTAVAAGVSLTQSLDRCVRVTSGQAVTVDIYASTASGVSTDSGTAPTSVSITQIGL